MTETCIFDSRRKIFAKFDFSTQRAIGLNVRRRVGEAKSSIEASHRGWVVTQVVNHDRAFWSVAGEEVSPDIWVPFLIAGYLAWL